MTAHPAITRAIEASEANEANQAAAAERKRQDERTIILKKVRNLFGDHNLAITDTSGLAIKVAGIWFTNPWQETGGFDLAARCEHGDYIRVVTLVHLGDTLRGLACRCVEMNDKENGPPC